MPTETDKPEVKDCTECRIVGTLTLSGLALYANHLRLTAPILRHRAFYGAITIGAAGLAAFRLLGP